MNVPSLPPGSPWAGWTPPNLKWCEDNLAGWITTPANTWSNLAYFVVAYWIWREARGASRELRAFAPALVLLGAASFAFHASYTFAFQVADFVGMYLVLFLFIVLNLRRAGVVTVRTQTAWYAGGVAAFTAVMLAMAHLHLPYQSLVLVLAAVIGAQEARLAGTHPDRRELRRAWALFAAAFTCSALDLTRCWCDPSNHWLQGHAVWHVLSALGLHRGFRYYLQFRFD